MSAQIIEFGRPRLALPVAVIEQGGSVPLTRAQRRRRRDAWHKAEAKTAYWLAVKQHHHAVSVAKNHDLPEVRKQPKADLDAWFAICDRLSEAVSQQLLTPAPDLNAVRWKQSAAGKRYLRVTVTAEQIERAIAEDEAWLAANKPNRRPRQPAS